MEGERQTSILCVKFMQFTKDASMVFLIDVLNHFHPKLSLRFPTKWGLIEF
jgi:hypothetical protein